MSSYLADRRVALNLTQAQVAEMVGVSEATISRWESGSIANMRRDKIKNYAAALKATPSFIMEGANEDTDVQIPLGFTRFPASDIVPLVGQIACGDSITAEENIEKYVTIPAYWEATFALMCRGASMEPTIHDGDLVAIRKQPIVENGEIAAVRIDGEATLKHVYLYPDHIELRPENPAYESYYYTAERMNEVCIEGKAVGYCRNL